MAEIAMSSSSKSPIWHSEIAPHRNGAGYFLSQNGRLQLQPIDYIDFRNLPREASHLLVREWSRWIHDFKRSPNDHVRRIAVSARPLTQSHLDEYYRGKMIKKRALDAMETSIDQISAADAKVTELLHAEFDGEPLAITRFFNEADQPAEEDSLSFGTTLNSQRDLPVDDNDPCIATATPPRRPRRDEPRRAFARRRPPRLQMQGSDVPRLERNAMLIWTIASSGSSQAVAVLKMFYSKPHLEGTPTQRSYTIDFNCERTKALFEDTEWNEMKAFDSFALPRLPKSTTDYVLAVRNALLRGKHPASIAVPCDDRYSCDLVLRTYLSWTSLYAEEPSPFTNSTLTEAFWCREAWPLLKNLLSDVKGISMIDGEKQGTESSRHRNRNRIADLESSTARKRSGAKLDLIAHDSVNKRDWFMVESPKEWDEQSTKFLTELDVKVFRNLHLIAAHRLAELHSTEFRKEARFFSLYAGGRGFVTMELRPCPASGYVMLAHTYDKFILPATECMKTTIATYNECNRKQEEATTRDEDSDHDTWLYQQPSRSHVYDPTLCSSPIDPEDADDF
ncbi:hypothetical protein BGZ73_000656, partial [Actinomortierella ambigua]